MFLVTLESPQCVEWHQGDLIVFKPTLQELLILNNFVEENSTKIKTKYFKASS
jgi:hypothetical protein